MRNFLFFLLFISLGIAITAHLRYGGGASYPDLSTPPLLDERQLDQVLQYPEPIGNVAVSNDGRIFFTVHPESRPQGNKLLEWVAGAAVPFPNGSIQPHLFNTVLGITIDQQQRLWSIDHGRQGFGQPRLLAFDLGTGELVHDHQFRKEIAPIGSFLQDVRVSPDGNIVIISDGSVLRKKPALIVYEVEKRNARRILESHESVAAEDFLIQYSAEDLSFFAGLISLKIGVNGIAIDPGNEWLYFAATNNSSLYRIRMEYIIDATIPEDELRTLVERYSDKPLSGGLSNDLDGNIYVTDVEHNSISFISNERLLKTLIRSSDIRWASALSFGPDGYLYVADSAFPELILKTKEHITMQGPFSIYRFDTGHAGMPGQ